jgi:hypothetical protein
MKDEPRAGLPFLRERQAALRHELRRAEAAFGESINRIVGDVIDALRRSGCEASANKYMSAFEQLRTRTRASVNGSNRDAMNDAVEDFERLDAEVAAWFDSLKEKLGA